MNSASNIDFTLLTPEELRLHKLELELQIALATAFLERVAGEISRRRKEAKLRGVEVYEIPAVGEGRTTH